MNLCDGNSKWFNDPEHVDPRAEDSGARTSTCLHSDDIRMTDVMPIDHNMPPRLRLEMPKVLLQVMLVNDSCIMHLHCIKLIYIQCHRRTIAHATQDRCEMQHL